MNSDERYMAAVVSGDLREAYEMVARKASASGYCLGPVYHGATHQFYEFDISKEHDLGHHFGTIEQAAACARCASGRGVVSSYFLSVCRPIELPDLGSWQMRDVTSEVSFVANKEIPITAATIDNPGMDVRLRALDELNELGFQQDATLCGQKRFWELLHNLGYDGISYQNTSSLEGGGQSYVVGDASKIKLATAVVYDDAGGVVPLSKRFLFSHDTRGAASPLLLSSGKATVPSLSQRQPVL